MNAHYDRIGQLAQEHRREILANARRYQLRHELRHRQDRPVSRTFSAASAITRRLAAAIAKVRPAPAPVPARPLSSGETPASR